MNLFEVGKIDLMIGFDDNSCFFKENFQVSVQLPLSSYQPRIALMFSGWLNDKMMIDINLLDMVTTESVMPPLATH